jgi:NitT/TauT family transport system substrate-binding protein
MLRPGFKDYGMQSRKNNLKYKIKKKKEKRMKNQKNKLKRIQTLLLTVILLVAFNVSGCQQKEDAQLPKIRIGIITTGAVRPALVVAAKELGYYEEEGVDVELVAIDSVTSALTAIAADKLDILPYAIVPSLSAIAQGGNYTIIGGTASEGSTMVKGKGNEDVDFRNFNNWEGKKVGYKKTDTTIMLLQDYMESTGFDINKAEWIEIDDENATREALKKGTIDIASLTQEGFWVGEEAGLVEAFPIAEFLPNYICCRQTADTDRVKENRDAYVKVLKAQLRAQNDYKNNTDKVVKAVAKYIEQDDEYVRKYIATPSTLDNGGLVQFKNPVSPDPLFNKIEELYQVSKEAGVFEEKAGVNIKDHVDITLFKDAIDELISENPNDATYAKILELYERDNSNY